MLTGVCPGCGLRADLDVFCVQADANKALAAALDLPAPLGGRILRYLRLFSPPAKVLALAKTTRLLVELCDVIRSAQITRRTLTYPAPLELWTAALDAVLNQPPEVLPLTSHGYLFQVAWNLADRAAARQERGAEERLRQGSRPPAEVPATPALASAGVASAAPAPQPGAAALSAPAVRPARVPPPAEFRALLGQLTRTLVVPALPDVPEAPEAPNPEE